jgi:hypothetical protein
VATLLPYHILSQSSPHASQAHVRGRDRDMAQAQTHLAFPMPSFLPSFPFLLSVCLPFCLLDDTVRLLACRSPAWLAAARAAPATAQNRYRDPPGPAADRAHPPRPPAAERKENRNATQRQDRTGQSRAEPRDWFSSSLFCWFACSLIPTIKSWAAQPEKTYGYCPCSGRPARCPCRRGSAQTALHNPCDRKTNVTCRQHITSSSFR